MDLLFPALAPIIMSPMMPPISSSAFALSSGYTSVIYAMATVDEAPKSPLQKFAALKPQKVCPGHRLGYTWREAHLTKLLTARIAYLKILPRHPIYKQSSKHGLRPHLSDSGPRMAIEIAPPSAGTKGRKYCAVANSNGSMFGKLSLW